MAIMQGRRRFFTNAAIAGAAGFGTFGAVRRGGGGLLAVEPSPEIATIRLDTGPILCIAPQVVAEELLRAEGFTDLRYDDSNKAPTQKLLRDEVDWTLEFAPAVITDSGGSASVKMVAGMHVGCFELLAHEHIRSVVDLKGRSVGVASSHETPRQLVSIMASYVGVNPEKDLHWVSDPSAKLMDLFVDQKIDAFFTSPPRSLELRARGIGHSLVNSSVDRPWSQYFCCMLTGRAEFIRQYPVATKRVLRAFLKGADLCAAEPERTARLLVDRGLTHRYDYALQAMNELNYKVWRDVDPEDTVRWYALRMSEAGFTKSTPQTTLAQQTDWRFLNELKRELKV